LLQRNDGAAQFAPNEIRERPTITPAFDIAFTQDPSAADLDEDATQNYDKKR
jgi:hypothetical protein